MAIFRNERANVYRCLDSVKNFVDCVYISDTGSTDGTPDLVSKWGRENNVPTEVGFDVWKNFGHNRDRSYRMAMKSFPCAKYALLLDADMVLQGTLDKSSLVAPGYLVRQEMGGLSYWNVRLIRMDGSWSCRGRTHEAWCLTKGERLWGTPKLESLHIDDRGDGGYKAQKYPRDKELLLEGLNDEGDYDLWPRYRYYLGCTLHSLGEYEEAIKRFKERVLDGGWEEEVYSSLLWVGRCKEAVGQDPVSSYLESWAYRPSRIEGLYYLAFYYRRRAERTKELRFYRLALDFALKAKNTPRSKDISPVDVSIYDYRLDEEIATAGSFVDRAAGLAAYKELSSRDLPPGEKEWLSKVSAFYDAMDSAISGDSSGSVVLLS